MPKKTTSDLIADLPEEQRRRIEAARDAFREAGITAETLKGKSHREIVEVVNSVLHDGNLLPPMERDPVAAEQDRRIVAALHEAGVNVSSVFDLMQSSEPYPFAIPVLLRYLHEDLDRHIKEGIVRALTVKEARGIAAKPLLREFERLPLDAEYELLKWAIGNALTIVADKTDFDAIARLIQDKRHGTSRQMMVEALGKTKDPRAVDVLLPLLKDEDVHGHAIVALGQTRSQRARRYIEPFVNHPYGWIQTAAKRALRKIDKEQERMESRRQKIDRGAPGSP